MTLRSLITLMLVGSLCILQISLIPLPALAATYSISGMVYYSQTPLDGVRVELIQGREVNYSSPALQNTTTHLGAYRFTGVVPGYYNVKVYGPAPEFVGWFAHGTMIYNNVVISPTYLTKQITSCLPGDNEEIATLTPTFSWDPNPEAVRYTVWIHDVNSWTIVETGESATTSYTVKHALTPGVLYCWDVGASDVASNQVGSSYYWDFTVYRPEHEVSISITAPQTIQLSASATINATISNQGRNNETNIVTSLFVNDTLTDTRLLSFIRNASFAELTFQWIPPQKIGLYNVTVYVASLHNESSIQNNEATAFVSVTPILHQLSCSIQPAQIVIGESITISGALSPALANQCLSLTFMKPSYQTLKQNITCGADSTYSTSLLPDLAGLWTVDISWAGNATHKGAANTTYFTVNAQARALTINLNSLVTSFVTDPLGRSFGTDPKTRQNITQIPDVDCSGTVSQIIVIKNPLDGTYNIQIHATTTGSYTLSIELSTPSGNSVENYTGQIATGETQLHTANISGNTFLLSQLEPLPWMLYASLTILLVGLGFVLLLVYRQRPRRSFSISEDENDTIVY